MLKVTAKALQVALRAEMKAPSTILALVVGHITTGWATVS